MMKIPCFSVFSFIPSERSYYLDELDRNHYDSNTKQYIGVIASLGFRPGAVKNAGSLWSIKESAATEMAIQGLITRKNLSGKSVEHNLVATWDPKLFPKAYLGTYISG